MVVKFENFYSGGDEPENPKPEFAPFAPLNDLVLVKRYEEDNSRKGSFIVPEKFRQQSNRGIVVETSNDLPYKMDGSKSIYVGDLVTFGVYNAETLIKDGEELLLIRYNDIRGVERAL